MTIREAEIVRSAAVCKSKRTRGNGTPGVRRNQVKSGLQMWVDPDFWLIGVHYLVFNIHWVIGRVRG